VRFPRPYALMHEDERLSSLIARAGGLLLIAYADGGRFSRDLNNAGRVNVDITRAPDAPGARHDIILRPGDSLDIPEDNPTVRVAGAVNTPTSVLFEDGAGLDYYMANAGGYTRLADEGRVSVKYANGSARVKKGGFLFFGSSPRPGPGSVVFVPERDPEDRFDERGLIADLVGILGSTTTVIVVLTR